MKHLDIIFIATSAAVGRNESTFQFTYVTVKAQYYWVHASKAVKQ